MQLQTLARHGARRLAAQVRDAIHPDDTRRTISEAAAELPTALGWFSVGLGAIEMFAPRMLAKAIGLQGHETLLQTFGAREMVSGIGILSGSHQREWLMSRAAGDAMDLYVLGKAVNDRPSQRTKLFVAIVAVVGVTLLDVVCTAACDDES